MKQCDHCGGQASREVYTVKECLQLCVRCAEKWWADYFASAG